MLTFEQFNERRDLQIVKIEPIVKELVAEYFGYNHIIEKSLKMALFSAHQIVDQGYADVGTFVMKNGENGIVKNIVNNYFPGTPKLLSSDKFDILAKNRHVYYRGVDNSKFVSDLKHRYKGFVGHNNIYAGTWITDKKEYAEEFTHKTNNLIEILLKTDIRIAKFKDIHDVETAFRIKIRELQDENFKKDDFSKILHHQLEYLKNNFLHSTVVAALLKYDAIDADTIKDGDVYVILNKEKLIIRN